MDQVIINKPASQRKIRIGAGQPLVLIAGPCVIESEQQSREIAAELISITADLGIDLIFKASFDKANRTALESYRGPGIEKGLSILAGIREMGVPVISDIHEPRQAPIVAEVLDVIQIPAFLCRQTDLLVAAARTGKPINLKKGQFLSPWDMRYGVRKVKASGTGGLLLTERGASLGYNNLVVDMRSLPVMRSLGCPVIFDATHSVQLPGGAEGSSGGQRQFIPPLARAAVAAGVDGLFMEVHPDPDIALCDGPNSWSLYSLAGLLKTLMAIHKTVQEIEDQPQAGHA
ncbi:MAG: 3-deoxy-8-phosphooctulonate synthase [Deltaproteobacteria bacterium]